MRDLCFRDSLLNVSFLDHQHQLTWESEMQELRVCPGLLGGILPKFSGDWNTPLVLIQDLASSHGAAGSAQATAAVTGAASPHLPMSKWLGSLGWVKG